ncbi:hypothetical protein EGW08_001769 [Elysia chlorotica]|uniref:Homeobox domain-containing protein n=1 Tax=Elysia chlorotica TaxID=188477 RepID=A0A433U9M5_ELYCH|nr:hypothetical protein EGW08_001769 [Elysia chlorotica]
MDASNPKLEPTELGDPDDSSDKCDGTLACEDITTHGAGDTGQTATDRLGSLSPPGITKLVTSRSATPQGHHTNNKKAVSGEKFLSIMDILLNNGNNRPRVNTELNNQIYTTESTLARKLHGDVKDTTLPLFSAYSRKWEESGPDILNQNVSGSMTKQLADTLSRAKRSSGMDAMVVNPSNESTCENADSRSSGAINSHLNDEDNQSYTSSEKAGIHTLPGKHTESTAKQDMLGMRPIVADTNVPCVSNVPVEHPMWLGQAIWRHMWRAHLAATQSLSGICLSPYKHGIAQVIVHNDTTRCSSPQDVSPTCEAPFYRNTSASMVQVREANNFNDSSQSDGIQPPDTEIENALAEPAAPDGIPPAAPPPPRATYQVAEGSRRRRRQRQAYSAVQLNTLEAEFKMNRYVSSEKREALSQRLSLSENQVKAWFQNRRTKDKKQQASQKYAARAKESRSDAGSRPGHIGTSFQTQSEPPGIASALLVPSQTRTAGPVPPGILWNPPGHRQLVPLGLVQPQNQARGLAVNMISNAAQAPNYLAFLQRIL